MGVDVGRDPTVWNAQRKLYRDARIPSRPVAALPLDGGHQLRPDHRQHLGLHPSSGSTSRTWSATDLSLEAVGRVLTACGKEVHIATLPWVQNGQGWQHVDFCTLALEMFPKEGQGQTYLDQWESVR